MPIPCHLIAGPLGVGKTTAIRNAVALLAGGTAVIVNDFGETGYDAGLIGEAGVLRVKNIPGGCLCCTSASRLLPAIGEMSRRSDIRRILIEPSGIALLDPLLEMMRDAASAFGIEPMPVVTLFDPLRTRPAALLNIPYWRHLADRSGIAVINRCDLASTDAVDSLEAALSAWSPPKLKVIRTEQGRLDPVLFELRGPIATPGSDAHHRHVEYPSSGTFAADCLFDSQQIAALLEGIASLTERFKGIFFTEAGWWRFEIAGGRVHSCAAAPAARSYADWIGGPPGIRNRILECILPG